MKTRRNIRWEDLNMAEIQLQKLILHFAQSNKAEGKSPKTIQWYSEMLSDFTRFLETTATTPLLNNFDITATRDFIVHEQSRDLSPYTVQGKVRALKAFASWLCVEGYTPDNLLYNLKLPRTPNNLINPLTNGQCPESGGKRNRHILPYRKAK